MRIHETSRLGLLIGVAALAAALGCSGKEVAPTGEIAGYVAREAITREEVDAEIARDLMALRRQEFDLRSQGFEQIVERTLLENEAQARSVSVEELIRLEVEERLQPATDEAIQEFYDDNRDRLIAGSFEELIPDIAEYLSQVESNRLDAELRDRLREKATVRWILEPPRSEILVPDGEPARGPQDAAVTIVEFSDFQCPFCKQSHPVVEELLAEYGDRVRFVYRDYPLPNHPRAFPAAEAARCAGEQDRYWEYHGNLMTVAGDLSDEDLAKRAGEADLDLDAFSDCLESDRQEAAIQASIEDAVDAGVNSTPSFFINGRLLPGARPLEELRRIVDDELERASGSQ